MANGIKKYNRKELQAEIENLVDKYGLKMVKYDGIGLILDANLDEIVIRLWPGYVSSD